MLFRFLFLTLITNHEEQLEGVEGASGFFFSKAHPFSQYGFDCALDAVQPSEEKCICSCRETEIEGLSRWRMPKIMR